MLNFCVSSSPFPFRFSLVSNTVACSLVHDTKGRDKLWGPFNS